MTPPPSTNEGQLEEQFTALVEAVQEYALFLIDTGGTITSWNPDVRRVLGWEETEFGGQPFAAIFTPEDVAAGAPKREMDIAAREGVSPDERWHVRKDGSRFFAMGVLHPLRDADGGMRGYAKVVADATARHDAERRLARKAALIDLSPDAIFVEERANSRITFWSRGAEATYGYTREEALGRAAPELLRAEYPVPREDILAELEREGHWQGDLGHARRDGTRLVVSSRWALPPADGGRAEEGAEMLLVCRDVTEQRRLEAERAEYAAHQERIAETLQRSLLMAPPPDLFPGLTVKPVYIGAEEDVLVGGDFFDVFAVSENRVALVMGDVTGKGLEAAAFTAEVKYALRAILREYPSPAVALTRLNQLVADAERLDPTHLGQSYVALAVVVVDTLTGAAEATTAGMEMPFLLRVGTGEVVWFPPGGPLLGALEGAQYTGQREMMAPGDLLVMSTDGLTEARHPERRRDFFGVEGLAQAAREEAARMSSLADVGLGVVARARAFAGGAIRDDVCLLLARRRAQ